MKYLIIAVLYLLVYLTFAHYKGKTDSTLECIASSETVEEIKTKCGG